ncbi:MAG: Xaa-Pro aminopeptidase [Candidatus Binatia bacterium]|nr:MAG: Xaa-Pro aminopeptidase [Candidatus Binatia bacterium]
MFEAATFARRRRAFMDRLEPGSAALLFAAPLSIRSNDVEYRFRQDSDFYYLTGFPEPDAVALLLPGHPREEFLLFVEPRDAERETWVGPRAGVEGAMTVYGADRAFPLAEFPEAARPYLQERERLYLGRIRDPARAERVFSWFREWQSPSRVRGPRILCDAGEVLHEMRLRKSSDEIAALRRSLEVTGRAHLAAMGARRPGMYEYELEALLEYEFRRGGAAGPAYPSIVASGPNATVLHYTANDRRMEEGDLLLVDAGAELEFYCSDVTRTYPVGRAFVGRQRAFYDIVLAAQEAAIRKVAPGIAFDEVHKEALRVLSTGLRDEKILSASVEEILDRELYRPYFMHRTSHWLGIDVHDVGRYEVDGKPRKLEPGMVLTVEPGLYFSRERDDVPEDLRGTGIRIEDDVLVTPEGHEVLSAHVPKLPEGVR